MSVNDDVRYPTSSSAGFLRESTRRGSCSWDRRSAAIVNLWMRWVTERATTKARRTATRMTMPAKSTNSCEARTASDRRVLMSEVSWSTKVLPIFTNCEL